MLGMLYRLALVLIAVADTMKRIVTELTDQVEEVDKEIKEQGVSNWEIFIFKVIYVLKFGGVQTYYRIPLDVMNGKRLSKILN